MQTEVFEERLQAHAVLDVLADEKVNAVHGLPPPHSWSSPIFSYHQKLDAFRRHWPRMPIT